MEYNRWKGKEISEIGMGCYALSGAYGPVNRRSFKEVISHAYDLGINFFDTAETYGPKAERTLGEAVGPFREEVHISTKLGMGKGERPDLSYDHVMSACDQSIERLDTTYLDFYLVHFADPDTPIERTIGALEDLKTDGKIDHYGISHVSLDVIQEYIEKGDIDIMLMELNAVSRRARDELLPLCRKNDIGGVAFSVTGRGVLTGRYDKKVEFDPSDVRNYDPLFSRVRLDSALRIADKLEEVGERYDKTPVQMAVRWVLRQEGINCALTGTSRKEHLEENVGASGFEIGEDDLQEIDSYLDEEEEWLKEKEPAVVRDILSSEVKQDEREAEEVFSDLIYAVESAVDRGMVSEKEVMPVFRRLWGLRGSEDAFTKERLEEYRVELKKVVL